MVNLATLHAVKSNNTNRRLSSSCLKQTSFSSKMIPHSLKIYFGKDTTLKYIILHILLKPTFLMQEFSLLGSEVFFVFLLACLIYKIQTSGQ